MQIMKFLVLAIALSGFVACSNTDAEGDKAYNHPSSNAAKMSSDTLCYRAAGAKENADIKAEIRSRGLDCASILENDPLMNFQRY